MTLGIPRLKELLDQSKMIKTPSNRIHFKGKLGESKQFASFFADTLPLTRLGDIVKNCEIVYDPDLHATVVPADRQMVALNEELGAPAGEHASKYVIRLILNQRFMRSRKITAPMARKLLRNRLRCKAHVISSETNCVEWVMRIRFEKVGQMMQHIVNHPEQESLLCHRVIAAMMDTVAMSGHTGITGAHMASVDTASGERYVVDTQGCSLMDLGAAACIDWYETTSNDVNEVHSTLGLEAAVNVLFSELTTTISFDGTYVDPRHIMMIVNTMTRGGYIMPFSRHGINRMDTGPLLRCSFEETPDILCDAACFGEHDNGHGVSQNIMTGKLPEIGSGNMAIKVAASLMHSTMMHPRTDHVDQSTRRKTVLKSTIRCREQSTEIELHEVPRVSLTSFAGTDAHTVEAPFASSESETMHEQCGVNMDTSTIFASTICQAPFADAIDHGARSVGARSVDARSVDDAARWSGKEYMPSSPMSDSD